jgi:hypothetical protein
MVQVHGRRLDPRLANTLGYLANSLLRAGELADVEKQERTRKAWGALERSNDARIQEATSDPYHWVTNYTQTYNEQLG